jgi:ferredoxin
MSTATTETATRSSTGSVNLVGSGVCVAYAPGTFTHDDQAKAVLLGEPADPADAILTAVDACPTAALRVVNHREV